MNLDEVMAQLETMGTEQNRKIYRRHGVMGAQFGVSMANLDKSAKQIKRNTPLAVDLWQTGNHDARLLACRIADPAALDAATLDTWVQELDNYVVTDAFSGLVGRAPYARTKMEEWVDAPSEWVSTAGWNLLGSLAMQDKTLPDDFFLPYLDQIAREIHDRPNRTRYAMNNALIAIGIRNHAFEAQANRAGAQIGAVEVDHGETNCQTPDAVSYIRKTWEYKEKKSMAINN